MKYQVRIYRIHGDDNYSTLIRVVHDFESFEQATTFSVNELAWRGANYYSCEILMDI